jgi:mRNA interferase MazF
MRATTSFERGDIVLVRFPFTDLKDSRQRPAVVISSAAYNRRGEDVIVAAVSSARADDPGPFDHPLTGWEAAGLLHPSVVRTGKIVTIHRTMVRRRLGSIAAADLQVVDSRIADALGLT